MHTTLRPPSPALEIQTQLHSSQLSWHCRCYIPYTPACQFHSGNENPPHSGQPVSYWECKSHPILACQSGTGNANPPYSSRPVPQWKYTSPPILACQSSNVNTTPSTPASHCGTVDIESPTLWPASTIHRPAQFPPSPWPTSFSLIHQFSQCLAGRLVLSCTINYPADQSHTV